MCTVFTEPKVFSLKNRGASPGDIARAVHLSVVERLAAMLHRVGHGDSVVFSDEVAKNRAMAQLSRDKSEIAVLMPDKPGITGALGAAFYAV